MCLCHFLHFSAIILLSPFFSSRPCRSRFTAQYAISHPRGSGPCPASCSLMCLDWPNRLCTNPDRLPENRRTTINRAQYAVFELERPVPFRFVCFHLKKIQVNSTSTHRLYAASAIVHHQSLSRQAYKLAHAAGTTPPCAPLPHSSLACLDEWTRPSEHALFIHRA